MRALLVVVVLLLLALRLWAFLEVDARLAAQPPPCIGAQAVDAAGTYTVEPVIICP